MLVRRQEAARRPHPLQGSGRLIEGMRRERAALADLRADADLVIDTSDLNVHQLTDRIDESFGTPDTTRLKVTVISFGFKYGIPVDADFVADMRFLPNPFWMPDAARQDRPGRGRQRLRARPGRAPASSSTATSSCSSGVAEGYLREGKRFMSVAIGCTGGKHRSVAMTEEIARQLREAGYDVVRGPPRPRA